MTAGGVHTVTVANSATRQCLSTFASPNSNTNHPVCHMLEYDVHGATKGTPCKEAVTVCMVQTQADSANSAQQKACVYSGGSHRLYKAVFKQALA
jgi:hypothetical protein